MIHEYSPPQEKHFSDWIWWSESKKGSKVSKMHEINQWRSASLHSHSYRSRVHSTLHHSSCRAVTWADICWCLAAGVDWYSGRVSLAFSASRMAVMGKEQLWLSLRCLKEPWAVWPVCRHSVFQQSLRMRNTGLSRQLSYAPLDTLTTTLVMLLLGPQSEGTNTSAGRIASKTPFFFSMTLILLCRARVPVTLSRMSVAPTTVPVFGSLRLDFFWTHRQIPTSQKSRTHRDSKR